MKIDKHVLYLPGNQVEATVIVEPDSLRVLVFVHEYREEDYDIIAEWVHDIALTHYGHRDNINVTTAKRLATVKL